MDIFRRRPLFLCCSVFLLASLAGFFLRGSWLSAATGGTAAIGAVLLCIRGGRRDPTIRWVTVAAVLLALAGMARSCLWFYGGERASLSALEGETVTVTGVVTDRRGSGSNLTAYGLELTSVNGEASNTRALLTCYYVSDLQPGYTVEMEARVVSLEEAAGEGYDATSLLGDGYAIGLLSDTETSVTITDEDGGGLRVKAGSLRRRLAVRLNALTPEAEGLPAALLLGDRTHLSDTLRRDFARAGVSHLLAVSGLHVTLLFGILDGILRLLRLSKRGRVVMLSLCALGYLVLLGFPPSATRAVIMLGAVYLSHLLSTRADPLTSLGLAGALILAVTPCAASDGGFWMSYLATLGLVVFMPALNRRLSEKARDASLLSFVRAGLSKVCAGICVGLVAMSFTLPVVAAVIGEMGILSPVATLLLTPLCGGVLVLSLSALPLGGCAVGGLLGGFAEALSVAMAKLAAWMGEPSWAVVSLGHPAVLPITLSMLVGVLILLTVRLPARKRWTVILPLLAGWIALGGVLGGHALLTRGDMTVTYLQPSSTSDMILLTEGNGAVICDLSSGSLTAMNRAVKAAEENGATEISVLMLTHYHSRTTGTLSTLLSRETVRALWLPSPDTEEEYYLLLAYVEKAEAAGVPVTVYEEEEAMMVFDGCAITLQTDMIKRSVQPVLLLSLETAEERAVYCGSAVFESGLAEEAAALVSSADAVIFGNHGPLVKAPFGADLSFPAHATVILSAEGDVAAWFVADAIDGQRMWLGEWQTEMDIGK